MIEPISVLIVDDSPLMRKLIRSFFEPSRDIEVVGTAMNGRFALQKLDSLKPDVIILDLEMPEMNGLEFLQEKKRRSDNTPVIILSSVAQRGARVTMEAIAAGASDFFLKPSAENRDELIRIAGQITELVRVYGALGKKTKPAMVKPEAVTPPARAPEEQREEPPPRKKRVPKQKTDKIEIIAIGISTGGPNALRQIFPHLRDDLDIPIVVVQHMPRGFTEEFAISLNRITSLDVKEAEEGDVIRSGRILIAPGDMHVRIREKPLARTIALDDGSPVNGHKPSVEVLFTSVAQIYKNRSCALIMTGMGKDGAEAIGSVYEEGGLTLAQDSDTCVVFGMPKAAIANGYIHKIVSLSEIPETLNNLNQ